VENGHSIGRPPIGDTGQDAAAGTVETEDAVPVADQQAEEEVDTQPDEPSPPEQAEQTSPAVETPGPAGEDGSQEVTEPDDEANEGPATEQSGSEIS
jgi:hypothetical protein